MDMRSIKKAGIVENALLMLGGVYLFVSPWLFSTFDNSAKWNSWIGGAALAVLAIVAGGLAFMNRRQEAIGAEALDGVFAAGAVWLFVPPWVLTFSAITAAAWSAWIVGVAVAAISLYSVYDVQTHLLPQAV